jgi:hypothetical protein
MTAAKRKLSATATCGLRFLDGVLQQLWTVSDGDDRQWDHWSDVPHHESPPEQPPINWKTATPDEREQYAFNMMRRTNPTLTLEKYRKGLARFREKEAIRRQEEAAKRKAKRDAKKFGEQPS